ncbi:hypothetical protein SLS63_003574 [Diaporthe eres]|uniref:Uncharacterized protein n=1 Tax=Diaporthe eres TaxID=83184 RepID=A0ABR1PGK1_DIAER
MQVPLTTLAVPASATAAHALPAGPPAPPPIIPGDLSGDIESAADAGGLIINGITQGIPKIITDIQAAKEGKKAWRNEQERLKADEDEKKLREALEARRKTAEENLEHAEGLRAQAEAQARQAIKDLGAAVKLADGLREAVAKIDEQLATIGIPDEDKYLVDPDEYEKPAPPPPEQPEERKKSHRGRRNNRRPARLILA